MASFEVITVIRSSMAVCYRFGFPLWKQMSPLCQTWQTIALHSKTLAVVRSNASKRPTRFGEIL